MDKFIFSIKTIFALPKITVLLIRVIFCRKVLLITSSAPGDILMAQGVIKSWAEKNEKIPLVLVRNKNFLTTPYFSTFFVSGIAYAFAKRLSKVQQVNYGELQADHKHLIVKMADRIGVSVTETLSPYYNFPTTTYPFFGKKYIVLQANASIQWTPNKNWTKGRMQALAKRLSEDFITVQIGDENDDALPVDVQLKGKTSLEQAASILKNAQLFIGLEGALMHLSKSVNTKSIILFGGYIHPDQTAYDTVTPLYTSLSCSPCLTRKACPYKMACMEKITVDDVLDRVYMSTGKINNSYAS